MHLGTDSILLSVGAALALGCGGSTLATGPQPDGGNPEAGGGSVFATGPEAGGGDPEAGGGSIFATGPEAGGGNPEAGADDGGGPDTTSDGAAPSCPATYADVPQFSPCSAYLSCNYFGQFNCACVYGTDNALEWECISFNCICSSGDDAGCVNQACNTDADCPSGQHCSDYLGQGGNVCSVGCEGDAGPGGPERVLPGRSDVRIDRSLNRTHPGITPAQLERATLSMHVVGARPVWRRWLRSGSRAPRLPRRRSLPWRTAIEGYGRATYKDVLPGGDLVYYGGGQTRLASLRASRARACPSVGSGRIPPRSPLLDLRQPSLFATNTMCCSFDPIRAGTLSTSTSAALFSRPR